MAALLAVGMLLSLTACGSNEEPASQPDTTIRTTSTATAAGAGETQPETSAQEQSARPPASGTTGDRPGTRPNTTRPGTTTATTRRPTTSTTSRIVRVTIPEGYTMVRTFWLLEEKGVASYEDLMKAAETYDFAENYPLVAAIPDDPYRCFKLEGYLFPSTYEFYLNDKPEDAIGRMLRGSRDNFPSGLEHTVGGTSYTMDEIVIIASLIEKEGATSSEASRVSAVIHNRLRQGMKLQLDSTVTYMEQCARPYMNMVLPWEDYTAHNSTYKCAALPSTPICNPGLAAINAALHPADSSALFFCSDKKTGEYYYADTYEEHQVNLEKAGITDNGNFQEAA